MAHYLVLNLAGAEDEVATTLIAEHERQMAECAAANPPQQPRRSRHPSAQIHKAMAELTIELRHSSADLAWALEGGSSGGTGTELALQQIYRPHMPPGQLSIEIRTTLSSTTVEITVAAPA